MDNTLIQYQNGNSRITILEDGTKTVQFEGERPELEYPMSLDIKITDWCDGGCAYCHEKSTKNGNHGDLDKIYDVLSVLPAGTELAIGGGDTLSHPDIVPFLKKLINKKYIPNITINQKHYDRHAFYIERLIENKLIYGLGISISDITSLSIRYQFEEPLLMYKNTVLHAIVGIDNPIKLLNLPNDNSIKLLILGYKKYGFGVKYENQIDLNKNILLYKNLLKRLSNNFCLSFDNLAIEQLDIKNRIDPSAWEKYYMGPEGYCTMYYDGVEDKYAVQSTGMRINRGNKSLKDCFALVKNSVKSSLSA